MGTENSAQSAEQEPLVSEDHTLVGSFKYRIMGGQALLSKVGFEFGCNDCEGGTKVVEVVGSVAVADLLDIVNDHADSHMTPAEISAARARMNLPEWTSSAAPADIAINGDSVEVAILEPSVDTRMSEQQTAAS